jgi:hypothetical protein
MTRIMEIIRIKHIMNSLTILKVVNPLSSLKQTGKISQYKMERITTEKATRYIKNTTSALSFRRKNRGAIRSDRACMYRAAIHNWVAGSGLSIESMAIPL